MSSWAFAITPYTAGIIERSLTSGRLSSYAPPLVRPASGETNTEAAIRLYQWNAEVAAALWPVMHVFEVTMRNAISEVIANVHGADWAHEVPFQNKLPRRRRDQRTGRLVGYGAREDLQKQARQHPHTGKVIPELKMVFWERMLTGRHDNDFWNHYMTAAFPYLPAGHSTVVHRNELRAKFESVRAVRNRLGHHESVCDRSRFDIPQIFVNMMTVLSWRDPALHDWVADFETVQSVLARRP